jgi:chromosomal replication initiator protein
LFDFSGEGQREDREVASVDANTTDEKKRSSGFSSQRRFARLSSFVTSEGNRFAHAAAKKVVSNPGSISPLYLYGPTGCGKTMLAEGLWSELRGEARNCLFLAAEQFTTLFLDALRSGQGLSAFRRRVREVDALLIDDIQFLHGKRATLQELLNTVDHFARQGKQLVLTADRAPGDLPGLGPELVARLSCGLIADLPALDAQARRGVLEAELARRGRSAPKEVIDLLVAEIPGDGRRLHGALNRLEAMHEATGKSITVTFAREALKDLLTPSGKMVRLADVEKVVCELFGIPSKSLQSEGKARSVTTPRTLAMYLARKHTRAGLTEISEHFGLRSHSTVVAAQKKVKNWIDGQALLGTQQGDFSADEAVRRAENLLRAI